MQPERGHWTSRLGFILAAAGSAIGLGNLWKFPYITWANQGGTFVLVYLVCIAAVGLPIMMAEILIGRKTQKGVVGALAEAAGPAWGWVGRLGVVTGFVILGYYTVIAGWTLRYFALCLGWTASGFETAAASGDAFGAFVSQGWGQILLAALFMAITMTVVASGISGGIERVSRVLMPALFGILVLLLVSALSMDGAGRALGFMFSPSDTFHARSALEALGHSFFTLSLGMGAMITYGSYLRRGDSVVRASAVVVVLDTLIAIAATVIMFSVIFSVPGMEAQVNKSTAGMLFITLPQLFYTVVPLGAFLAPLFYALTAFAALTSTISMLEVMVAYFVDHRGWSRRAATSACGVVTFGLSVLCGLSLGASPTLSRFQWVHAGTDHAKNGLFDHLDYLASNWMLPVGGLLITLAAGWAMTRDATEAELMEDSTPRWFRYGVWRFFIRWVAPVAVAAIIVAVMRGKDFT